MKTKIYTRVTSFIMALVMLFSMHSTVFALNENPNNETPQDMEFEDTLVEDISCLSEDALATIEEYVLMDDFGNFYIKDEAALRALLTEEQYAVVETQISMSNRLALSEEIFHHGEVAEINAVNDGTSSNPYTLTPGISKTVTVKGVFWFACTVSGATAFDVTTGSLAKVTVYKKVLFGKKLIVDGSSSRYFSRIISDSAINNGSNKYLVLVDLSQQNILSSITCTVKQHMDSKTRSQGAMWLASPYSACPDSNGNILYFSYWYLPADRVSAVVDYVDNINYLDYQRKLINGSISAFAIASSIISLGQSQTALNILKVVIEGIGAFAITEFNDFKQIIKDDIRTVAGYNPNTKKYTNGVVLCEFMSQGRTYYEVRAWNSSTMYGPAGWTGTWSTSYN